VVALLLAVAAMTWALTHRRMAGMDAGPGSDLGGPGWFAATWALMMAPMMLPAVAPMVAAYRGRTPSPILTRHASTSGSPTAPLSDATSDSSSPGWSATTPVAGWPSRRDHHRRR
jgi:hypothetical protein